jgi:hypothetical protein
MAHYLRRNDSEAGPQSVVILDTEGTAIAKDSAGGKHLHVLRAGYAYHWRYERGNKTRCKELRFTTHLDFWEWLYDVAPRGRTTWVVSHGISYDVQLLRIWDEIESQHLVFSGKSKARNPGAASGQPPPLWTGCIVLADPPTIISCKTRAGAPLKIVDLRNWCNCPLPELADTLRMNLPRRYGEDATEDDVIDYCSDRSAISGEAFGRICDVVRHQALGQFRPTAASQAHHAWRHPDVPCRVCASDDPEVRALERRAYYGARCMVYFHGSVLHPSLEGLEKMAGVDPFLPKGFLAPVYQLDVVCCYGSVMRDRVYPCVHSKTLVNPTIPEALAHTAAYCTLADVAVDAKDVPYPVRDGQEVSWMVGKFTTTLAGPELRPAIVRGDVKEVLRMECYVADRPFDRFADRLWTIRQMYQLANCPLEARLAKVMMAVLHGKLAQRLPRWELVPGKLAPQPWGTFPEYDGREGKVVQYRAIGNVCQVEQPAQEPEDALPAMAAYVASYARKLMELLRHEAMRHCVLYEDADSLHVTREGLDRLKALGWLDENEMGKLRVVRSADRAVYYGRKDYEIGDHVVRCGVSRDASVSPRGDFLQEDFQRLDSVVMGRPPAGALSSDRQSRLHHELLGCASSPDGWTRYLIAD